MPDSAVAAMPHLTYTLFDPEPCCFPSPRVPLLPSLSLGPRADAAAPAHFELVGHRRARRYYTRGRYALFDAYRMAGVGADGGLLAPAYHCRTMLDPAISLGAQITLYPMLPSLAPDLDGMKQLLETLTQRPRALLLTHYFGFAQDAAPMQAFCKAHGLVLIEDCSHALFNRSNAPRLGQYGRYTIASPYKLLPCEEGGLLIAAPDAEFPPERPHHPTLATELRTLSSALGRWRQNRRARVGEADIKALPAQLASILAQAPTQGVESISDSPAPSSLYAPSDEGLAGSFSARILMRLSHHGQAVERRRGNYLHWEQLARRLPHCKPLFPALPEDCVPYMFPLLLDFPQQHFYALKKLGMPIWRWDDMAQSDCTVARRYRQHLLHLPCHQALSDAEMRWMTAAVELVLTRPLP